MATASTEAPLINMAPIKKDFHSVEVNALNLLVDSSYNSPQARQGFVFFIRQQQVSAENFINISELLPMAPEMGGKNLKEAVYVDVFNHLIYDSNSMKMDELYKVVWQESRIALRKTIRDGRITVDLYEFEPEK